MVRSLVFGAAGPVFSHPFFRVCTRVPAPSLSEGGEGEAREFGLRGAFQCTVKKARRLAGTCWMEQCIWGGRCCCCQHFCPSGAASESPIFRGAQYFLKDGGGARGRGEVHSWGLLVRTAVTQGRGRGTRPRDGWFLEEFLPGATANSVEQGGLAVAAPSPWKHAGVVAVAQALPCEAIISI